MKIKAYKNYGVLGTEKTDIYTVGSPVSTAVTWDEIEVEIPEEFKVSENRWGQILIDVPGGKTYLARELLSQRNGEPVLIWHDGIKRQCVYCEYQEV